MNKTNQIIKDIILNTNLELITFKKGISSSTTDTLITIKIQSNESFDKVEDQVKELEKALIPHLYKIDSIKKGKVESYENYKSTITIIPDSYENHFKIGQKVFANNETYSITAIRDRSLDVSNGRGMTISYGHRNITTRKPKLDLV